MQATNEVTDTRPQHFPGRSWFSEFRIHEGIVHYHQTGARIRLDGALLWDILAWSTYYLPVRALALVRRIIDPGPRLWFTPQRPPPWYLAWIASSWIGARNAPSAECADAVFYFEDATWGQGIQSGSTPSINGACTDVSKSEVARVFERVFGYPLSITPEHETGLAVEKGEINGAHDGRIIECPQSATSHRVYQRLIETGAETYVEDLRTPCIGGKPIVVFVKRRPRSERFENHNTSVSLAEPERLFSPDEIAKIGVFAREMKLDWGGLDILRDRDSGRLYIVDVNKTDMPPLALPFLDKMRASRRLGIALKALVQDLQSAGTRTSKPNN
jgi:hypothetical protein